MPVLMESWSSPKFITCPDCGERYDHARKRRLIDTCGHPRCYACLFVDNPCPLCIKLPQSPKSRPTSFNKDGFRGSHDSLLKNRSASEPTNEDYKGSHPNLNELHKMRAATLPRSGFRTDNYFRSLYKYDPSSQENLSDQSSGEQHRRERPKSAHLPNYHTSLDNLHDKFWKSVQRTSRPGSPTSPSNNLPPSPLSRTHNSTSLDENVTVGDEHSRLVVPSYRTRSRTVDTHMEGEVCSQGFSHSFRPGIGNRPRSASDLLAKLTAEAAAQNERAATHSSYRENQHQRAMSCSPTQLYFKSAVERRHPSDRSSDASSVRVSDSWSDSSCEEELFIQELSMSPKGSSLPERQHLHEEEKHKTQGCRETSDADTEAAMEAQQNCKKPPHNLFANTTYWVMGSPSSGTSSEHTSKPPRRGDHRSKLNHEHRSHSSVVWSNGEVRTKVSTL